jgi:hypothetical protein
MHGCGGGLIACCTMRRSRAHKHALQVRLAAAGLQTGGTDGYLRQELTVTFTAKSFTAKSSPRGTTHG